MRIAKEFENILKEATKTYKSRSALYGEDSCIRHGKALHALFNGKLVLETEEDFIRFCLMTFRLAKETRYASTFKEGGHLDSIHDIGIYAFITEAFDNYSSKEGE